MEVWHRIGINSKKDRIFFNIIEDLKIKYEALSLPGGESSLIIFDIVEHDPNWLVVSELIASYGASNMVETLFSEEEIRAAEWLQLISSFEQGYPQPKSTWPIKQGSYEIICPKCLTYHQVAPMRFKKEPNLGKKSFMNLIWAKEVFCKPEVITSLNQIQAKGYEIKNAVIHKTGEPVEQVRQLYVPCITAPGFIPSSELKRIACPLCGKNKILPSLKGKNDF